MHGIPIGAELEAAVPEILRLSQECEQVLVLMNNPWRGQATINAQMLMELLGKESEVRSRESGVRSEVSNEKGILTPDS